jgi:hypothetical protein
MRERTRWAFAGVRFRGACVGVTRRGRYADARCPQDTWRAIIDAGLAVGPKYDKGAIQQLVVHLEH